jgi:hypothetical protein
MAANESSTGRKPQQSSAGTNTRTQTTRGAGTMAKAQAFRNGPPAVNHNCGRADPRFSIPTGGGCTTPTVNALAVARCQALKLLAFAFPFVQTMEPENIFSCRLQNCWQEIMRLIVQIQAALKEI